MRALTFDPEDVSLIYLIFFIILVGNEFIIICLLIYIIHNRVEILEYFLLTVSKSQNILIVCTPFGILYYIRTMLYTYLNFLYIYTSGIYILCGTFRKSYIFHWSVICASTTSLSFSLLRNSIWSKSFKMNNSLLSPLLCLLSFFCFWSFWNGMWYRTTLLFLFLCTCRACVVVSIFHFFTSSGPYIFS